MSAKPVRAESREMAEALSWAGQGGRKLWRVDPDEALELTRPGGCRNQDPSRQKAKGGGRSRREWATDGGPGMG